MTVLNRRIQRRAAALVAVGAWALATAGPDPVQPTFEHPEVVNRIDSPLIAEASGLAASHANHGLLYAHNDSGDRARVYALDASARLIAILNLADTTVVDCEDICVGPGPTPGVSYVYLGDIGDNSRARKRVVVYRFPEPHIDQRNPPTPLELDIRKPERIELEYEDGPHDAESLMLDPRTGDLLIASKSFGSTTIYMARADELVTDSVVTLRPIATIKLRRFQMVTAGDISPSGGWIILRTYGSAMLWTRDDATITSKTFDHPGRAIPLPVEPQGEALAFDAKRGGYYTLSEGENQPLYYIPRATPPDDTNNDDPQKPPTADKRQAH